MTVTDFRPGAIYIREESFINTIKFIKRTKVVKMNLDDFDW